MTPTEKLKAQIFELERQLKEARQLNRKFAESMVSLEFKRDAWRRVAEGYQALVERYQRDVNDELSRLDL